MEGGSVCLLEDMNGPVKKIIHVIVKSGEGRENEKAKAFRLMT